MYSELVHSLCGRPKTTSLTSGKVPDFVNLLAVPYITAVNHVPCTLKN